MPGVQLQFVDGHRRGADAGVVEQQVQAAVGLADAGEERLDTGGIGDVAGYRQGFAALLPGFCGEGLQRFGATGGEDHAKAVLQQAEGDGAADALGGTGDEGDGASGGHGRSLGGGGVSKASR